MSVYTHEQQIVRLASLLSGIESRLMVIHGRQSQEEDTIFMTGYLFISSTTLRVQFMCADIQSNLLLNVRYTDIKQTVLALHSMTLFCGHPCITSLTETLHL